MTLAIPGETHLNAGSRAVAVYCGSSMGRQKAYALAAESLGKSLAESQRHLIYGGGSSGIMGVVSGAALKHGGKVTGIVPYTMVQAGGEGEKVVRDDETDGTMTRQTPWTYMNETGREKMETIVVDSMHERKVEMAKRVGAFIGLPGGFGTFEEVFEVTTWTQIGIHNKPVILLNVLGFYDALKQLIHKGVEEGYIQSYNKDLIIFIDGPESPSEHENYEWGSVALKALDQWKRDPRGLFDWTIRRDGTKASSTLSAT